METFSVHGAPSEYILQEGILNELEPMLIERGIQKVLIVHGQKSWQAAMTFFPAFTSVTSQSYIYSGECSLSQINFIAALVNTNEYDAVIGIGGGKVLDLVKSACHVTHKQAILIPTLASNCSPWTPVSVIYDDAGTFIRFDIYPTSASLVLVEPRILLQAPVNLLIAGIGDTLAKWYEADVQMAVISNKPVALQISHYTAKQCKDVIMKHAKGAIQAVTTGFVNDDFIQITETIIMLAGMVGGFGDHYGRIAGAHSIHNGLTVLEETHHALHGEKVAYGILVQLVLENKWSEIDSLLPIYRELGLPCTLHDLGVTILNKQIIADVAGKATSLEESIHVMPIGAITKERVAEAITSLENKLALEKELA
ncbi:iron-containing alcohol dehydrogenase family protein [Bacillus massiliigorillae]|uniref:iron-containing alcohol dehydrogenase family protein n=1 Tax=Bacillus massiliigorillae TaxID=1243664 RepID=UPI0003A99B97|nr:iron-containing alcohol dehydrogenase family protein [Bacillus massiliigorillae]